MRRKRSFEFQLAARKVVNNRGEVVRQSETLHIEVYCQIFG
jgi:hypothetical protein